MTPLPLSSDSADHAQGVVYRNPRPGPRTHVLVIGVGSYPSSDLAELSSPAASARAVADWFLGYGPTGFSNQNRPLGSLAILLSEPGGGKADALAGVSGAAYRGIATLRPNYENAFAVTEQWRDRVSDNPDNMAVVYACGHGLSDESRTAFILADYKRNPKRPFEDLVDVEEFIKAVATLPASAQLLFFDCCRNEVDTGLQSYSRFSPLLHPAGYRSPDIGQIALFATVLTARAEGRKNDTSLFAASLLAAFDLGATRPTGKWVVRRGTLVDTVAQCLALYGRSAKDIQQVDGQLSGRSFDINYPTYSTAVRTFVSFVDPQDWGHAEIALSRVGASNPFRTIRGSETNDPFFEEVLQTGDEIQVSAVTPRGTFSPDPVLVFPPALFVALGEPSSTEVVAPGNRGVAGSWAWRLPSDLAPPGTAVSHNEADKAADVTLEGIINIEIMGPMATNGAVVTIEALSETSRHATETAVVALNDKSRSFHGAPGQYRVSVAFPSGLQTMRVVTLNAGEQHCLSFDSGRSPREFLLTAATVGVVASGTFDRAQHAKPLAGGPISIRVVSQPRFAEVAAGEVFRDQGAEWTLTEDDTAPRRYALATVQDELLRFQTDDDSKPLWAEVAVDSRRELCVIPTIGRAQQAHDWRAEIAIDRELAQDRNLAASLVRSKRFTGLTGHLARRDFDRAARVLETLQTSGPDVFKDSYNPLAQIAAGLILAATAPAQAMPFDSALEALARRFPGVPDGLSVLGRRRWSLARTDEDRAKVLDLFRQGFDRGVPVFALSLDWLVQGLGSLDRGSQRERAVATLARRVDSARCFTCIRLDPAIEP